MAASHFRYLRASVENQVGILQLDHPEKRNALGWELHQDIIDALGEWIDDDDVACVLFIGNEDFFCSGWDLDVLNEGDDLQTFNELAHRFMRTIYDYGKPTVCAVSGMAPGYGMDVANMCDVTIASENARFGSSQVKYAMNGFYGGMQRKCGPMAARRLYFTGDSISASEAYRIGLIDELAPVGKLRDTALDMAGRIAANGTEMCVTLKQVALRSQNMDHLGGLAYELMVTQDLLKRPLFKDRISRGFAKLKAGASPAVARLVG